MKRLIRRLLLCSVALPAVFPLSVHAATPPAVIPSDFNLQVSPSPLVSTVMPGVKTQLVLHIHNSGSGTENLKIEPRSFTLNQDSTKVDLGNEAPPEVASWVSFSAPKFSVPSGQTFDETVNLNVPKQAGFSYSFALVINRQSTPTPTGNERVLNGSLAIFTLLNVNRPGATSSLQVTKFTASKRLYEYLPASFSVQFKNSGNTIAQPYGNIFLQRGSNSQVPLATLNVNKTQGYILPGTLRTVSAQWNDGFPVYKTVTAADGKTSQKLVWNWANLSKLRIGRYTAHLVAVYNQAGHDVPIEGTVSFWVIPWKILLVLLLVALLLLFSLFTLIRIIIRRFKRLHAKRAAKKSVDTTSSSNTPADKR